MDLYGNKCTSETVKPLDVVLVATNMGAVSWHHMLLSLVLDYQPHAHAQDSSWQAFQQWIAGSTGCGGDNAPQ